MGYDGRHICLRGTTLVGITDESALRAMCVQFNIQLAI